MNLNLLLGMAKDHFKLHTMQEVNTTIESSGLSTPDSKTKKRYCDTVARTKARIRRPNENDDHDYDHDSDDDNDQS